MLSQLLHPRPVSEIRDEFVIAPHHPDRLGRPAAQPGSVDRDRFQQALTWNVFRTLELIAPAFWLRRLHLRLTGEPAPTPPQVVRVSLWRRLALPPIQRIDGARPEIVVDAVIETEHAIWSLIAAPDGDYPGEDVVASAADAGAWLAGAREHHLGLIETRTTEVSFGGVLKRRYGRSRESLTLRSATRGPTRPTSTSFGVLEWRDLVAVLDECRGARNLLGIERALAQNAIEWLRSCGYDGIVE
jgi:hypothetical protein